MRRRDRPDELVQNAAATGPERLIEVLEALSLADEDRAPADPRELEDVLREHVVARAEEADQHGGERERGGRQAERVVAMAHADAEREREHGHKRKRRDDAAEPGTELARGVQVRAPEHEQHDHRQEREPFRGRVTPEHAPERREVAVDGLAQD